jgi:hypothetical protein
VTTATGGFEVACGVSNEALAQAREEEESGRRTAVAELLTQTFDLADDGPDPDASFNREIAEAALNELEEEARASYIASMKWAERLGDDLAQAAIGERLNAHMGFCKVLRGRWGLDEEGA